MQIDRIKVPDNTVEPLRDSTKQEKLVSGENIKTINNESLLGSGNIEIEDNTFQATYGTTTLSEITTAFNAGKLVYCIKAGAIFILGNLQSSYCYFGALNKTTGVYLLLSGSSWSMGQATFDTTGNKVTSLSSSSTDTQYPSAKCIYDIVGDIETLINAL